MRTLKVRYVRSAKRVGELLRFWNTSAVIPLLIDEPTSAALRTLVREDPAMVVW